MQHTGHNYYFDRKYQISWSTAKKVLPLYQQFPPRLFTMRTRAELFYTPMVTYAKQPLSIADQMEILKSRGILFDNEQAAIEYLK